MANMRNIGLILWKNWILRKRHYFITALEIILPLLFTIILVLLRSSGGNFEVKYIDHPEIYNKENVVTQNSLWNNNVTIMFSPNESYARELMTYLKDTIEDENCKLYNCSFPENKGSVNLKPVQNEEEMEELSKQADFLQDSSLFGGIAFVNDFPKGNQLLQHLRYRIRLRNPHSGQCSSGSSAVDTKQWNTDKLTNPFASPGPQPETGCLYKASQFLLCQHLIAMKFIDITKEKSAFVKYNADPINATTSPHTDIYENIELYSEKFPYPPYYQDDGFKQLMENILPLFIVLSYIFISPSLIKNIVLEKEMGTKELMKLMGLPGWIQWSGWFVSAFIMMAVSAVIIVTLLCTHIAGSPLIAYSAPELVYFIFLLYIASAIMFCFFVSSLFSKPTLASAVGIIAWILTFSLPFNLLTAGQTYSHLSLSDKLAVALLPNMAMAWSIRVISSFESRSVGLQWDNLAEPSYKGETMCMYHVMIMFAVDIALYGVLTWYIDNVLPGKFGVRKPWNFLFTKSYWVKEKPSDIDFDQLPSHINSPEFEQEPTDLTPTVIIKNLTKSFGLLEHTKPAVDDLSLNFYEGQITALLGHNGAGKTTTMSMLTGMFSPTKGTATINGYDIRTQMDAARENLGLCPQHNMLFDILTVSEHLTFFGKLKNLSGQQLQEEVDSLTRKLQLWEKRDTFAQSLSGGMKRKLNLGISLIGGSKVVMLDEPTSGLDPEARRAIWDLLQEFRPGRCIILTTHFMEEADVLGDRIAIMAQGKVQCCGTPYFLKKRFGAGYHLTVSKTDDCDVSALSTLVKKHLPEAYLNSNVNNELSYTLPAEKTSHFPAMFEELEGSLSSLGINGFGVSVTTMEEVFLKVGELSEKVQDHQFENGDDPEKRKLVSLAGNSNPVIKFNTGVRLLLQQLYGLLLKRWHYAKRRWILILAQIVMPIMMVVMVLFINNKIGDIQSVEPPLLMDISQYGKTKALENHTALTAQEDLAKAYRTTFPPDDQVYSANDIMDYLITLGVDDYNSYREEYIVAADFNATENQTSSILSWYNGVYLHTLPLTVNIIHNTILQAKMKSTDWTIQVENAPLPVDSESTANAISSLQLVKSIIMGIFIPIGLSFLSSSFVVFPIQERTSKSKHLQLMTGVGGTLFWGASFLWDYVIHFISSCVIVIVFATMDDSKIYSGSDQLGVIFLLLLLYGWAALPFSYMVSFICKLPASGFALLSVVNMIAGMILSMMIFLFSNMGSATLKDVGNVLQWFCRFLPTYTVTMGFMNMPRISSYNSQCDLFDAQTLKLKCSGTFVPLQIKQCCQDCAPFCLVPENYFGWNPPAIGQEVLMLVMDGVLYFLLLFFIERGIMYRVWYMLKSKYLKMSGNKITNVVNVTQSGIIDSDVAMEKTRIQQLLSTTIPSDDALLVHNLTKQFWSFRAVDDLSFGVKNAECFGLLGINGAGKTTTFRMLTGDEVMTDGNAFLHGISLKDDRTMFLKQISYCPQFDAILDHLTGRETLLLFARLRGIPESEIKYLVNHFLLIFDLSQHADKITMAYSGGNKRKLSAAIAFLGNPPMVFLDEPTTGVDPVARRKLWDILLAAKNKGTSLILTSHSMEECEVLCSRLAIMVNGQFKCLGGIQHLKSKFGQGFMVIAKMSAYANTEQQAAVQQQLQHHMYTKFPGCILKDVHQATGDSCLLLAGIYHPLNFELLKALLNSTIVSIQNGDIITISKLFEGLVHYHITDTRTPWRYLFSTMEETKHLFNLEDYSVSQTSLEQVFLSFARQQRVDNEPKFNAVAL